MMSHPLGDFTALVGSCAARVIQPCACQLGAIESPALFAVLAVQQTGAASGTSFDIVQSVTVHVFLDSACMLVPFKQH